MPIGSTKERASQTLQVVVNADDFGISEPVNEAIVEGHRLGLITSTTLLVNGPAVPHALTLAQSNPNLSVGIHLNTSEFAPVSPTFAAFRAAAPDVDLRTSRVLDRRMLRAVAAEWNAQIDRAEGLGFSISHLDSHHFDHVNPVLLPVLLRLVRSRGYRRVRGMHNLWVSQPSLAVRSVKHMHRSAMRVGGIATTTHMCDVGSYMRLVAEGRQPTQGTVELMAHPGHPSYATETSALMEGGPEVIGSPELVSWAQVRVS